jgi:PleD family two-component response regulator
MGVAIAVLDYPDYEERIRQADEALYRAKELG